MKFKLFKKEYEITTKQLFKFIAFCFFVSISAYLSLNMFIQLGHEASEKIAMMAISVGVEAFKVYLAISLSTTVFTAIFYGKKMMDFRKKEKILKEKKQNPNSSKVFTNSVASIIFLILYLVTAFTSLTASLGYALTTVNRYSEERQTVDNSIAIAAIEGANTRYLETIRSYESIIASSNKTLEAYDAEAAREQPVGQEWRRASALNSKATLQKKIDEYNTKIIDIRTLMNENDTRITDLKLGQTNTAGGLVTKSMFELIGKEVNLPASTVMFILIAILAIVIELGILTTSPHTAIIEEKEIQEIKPEPEIKIESKPVRKIAPRPEIKRNVDTAQLEPVVKEIEVPQEPVKIPTQDFELVVKEIEVSKPPIIDLSMEASSISEANARVKVDPKKIEQPIPKVELDERVIIKKKQLPIASVNTNIDDLVNELDKVSEKSYNEEDKKTGLLNLLNEKQLSPLKNKDRIVKLAENI